jgi:hypothetical protein
MKLTPELARKYAAYRGRYLGGSRGVYKGATDGCAEFARVYKKDRPVPFMVIGVDAATRVGSFLNADRIPLVPLPGRDFEDCDIASVFSGDNLVYSSIAMLCFVSEYAIGQLKSSLDLAKGIADSWVRLGSYQRGYLENGDAPFGFLLRADSADSPDANENICNFEDGEGSAAATLCPSCDQYATLLPCIKLARDVLKEMDARVPAAHRPTYDALLDTLDELVDRIVDYVAKTAGYAIRWEAPSGTINMPPDDRGPYCHYAAYPFARIAAAVLRDDANDYPDFIGALTLSVVRDLVDVLVDQIGEACREAIPNFLREKFSHDIENVTDNFDLLAELFNIAGKIIDLFHDHVLTPILDFIVDPIKDVLGHWDGDPVGPIDSVLAQILFDLFVTGTLLDTSDAALFDDMFIRLPLRQVLNLIGPVNIPGSLHVGIDIELTPPEPSWWHSPPMPEYDPPSFQITLADFSIDVAGLLDNCIIPIPATGLLRKLAAVARGKAYLKHHAYLMMSGGDLFGQIGNAGAAGLAYKHDNAWFMALAHRFHGAPMASREVAATLKILESAPEAGPRSQNSGHWNEDFRWIRDVGEDSSDAKIFGGMDLMAPLMVACSLPADLADNKDTLLDALMGSPPDEGGTDVFRLPFIGGITNQPLIELKAGGMQGEKTIYISVVFDRPAGNDEVVLTIPAPGGGTQDVTFTNSTQTTKLVVALLEESGVVIKSASANAKGYIAVRSDD